MRTLAEIKKEHFRETGAVDIGEDGKMFCFSSTKRGAFIKFRRHVRGFWGEWEADELKMNRIRVAHLHRMTEKDWEESERSPEDETDDFCIRFTKQKGDATGWFYSD